MTEDGQQDDPNAFLSKLGHYVNLENIKRVARLKARQKKQDEGETFDNFLKDKRILQICILG